MFIINTYICFYILVLFRLLPRIKLTVTFKSLKFSETCKFFGLFLLVGLNSGLFQVEADDFSSGTSSRSTKLIHGGVRYLQKAIMSFDYEQV